MVFYILPKLPIPDDYLIGLVTDKRDSRCGEVFRVGSITQDPVGLWQYVHHICPDGTHYTSRSFHPKVSLGVIRSIEENKNQEIRRTAPDVNPPVLYYRFDDSSFASQTMAANGLGLAHLKRDFLSMNHGVHTIERLRRDYKALFGDEMPLRTER